MTADNAAVKEKRPVPAPTNVRENYSPQHGKLLRQIIDQNGWIPGRTACLECRAGIVAALLGVASGREGKMNFLRQEQLRTFTSGPMSLRIRYRRPSLAPPAP